MMKLSRLAIGLAMSACAGQAIAQTAPVAAPAAPVVAPAVPPKPTVADVARNAPPAPDYADPAMWAAGFGGLKAAATLPAGASPIARHAKVDVFYIHPTTFRGGPLDLNQDPRNPQANKWADESVVARQGGVFSGCCNVFSPRYRAASFAVFADPAVQAAAFELAYSDIERAFDVFLKQLNGRPFIIAGHSQGAFHTATLLERRVDGTPLQKRMVAAYIIGINIGEGEFGRRFKHVPICDRPAQTGCGLQWNAMMAGTDLTKARERAQSTYVAKYGDNPGKRTLCVNPITFDRKRPASTMAQARGAVPGSPGFGAMQPLKAKAVAATCDDGYLVVTLAPGLGLDPLPGGVMHFHDVGLFYADIRANAAVRVAAYLRAHPAARRSAR
ncbi:DUF3089 domain-containing protein [Novosphingobium sp. FSY-8]|uniref:DUF3089 domain-containing protein n=1 Tax=Novosphingobium ovatum TaxID=1908523 RepID=A0ABW9XBR5_9SPHN|nr:DUF3089 domain-containing protein [Novosphingobium ovatum]NBC35964.1 DUF3089 domain-containing protein [Novosphingobium ovatum]